MIVEVLKDLFDRDLKRLETEITSYRSEANIWLVDHEINNSGGNLCLHLIGNLKTYIGAILGDNGYVRDREFEFAGKDVASSDLVKMVQETHRDVLTTLDTLSDTDLEKNYPQNLFGKEMTTCWFLMHLSSHLNYHLGQINYHRRLLDK